MIIKRAEKLNGDIALPGDKSISHRAAMLGAMAEGVTRISNFATSADCASTLDCLTALGVEVNRDGGTVEIRGAGKQGLAQPAAPLDCGNSGTTARLISGILAGNPITTELRGDESLSSRPMNRVIDPLKSMGAEIRSADGRLPLTIVGSERLRAIDFRLPVASAQVKSCVLLAGLNADGTTTVSEPPSATPGPSTRDHTELMLASFGARIGTEDRITDEGFVHAVSVSGDSELSGTDIMVPGDISSAAFFLVAAACLEGSEVVLRNVGVNPTRSGVIDVMKQFGAEVSAERVTESAGEPVGDLVVRGGLAPMSGAGEVSGELVSNLIDELPVLAVLGTRLEGGIEVRGAAELRHKESDRIDAVVRNLMAMGADVEEYPDGFRVGHSELKGARVESFGDHRIAMAFAVAGLLADGETVIEGAECVSVSFPDFFELLDSIVS